MNISVGLCECEFSFILYLSKLETQRTALPTISKMTSKVAQNCQVVFSPGDVEH